MTAIVIFAKVPGAGAVKTRIAAISGTATALAIYRELLQTTAT